MVHHPQTDAVRPCLPLASARVDSALKEYDALKSGAGAKLVVVDFSAEWCGPCKFIAPTFEEYSKTYTDVVFIHVDVDVLSELPDGKDVRGVPTFKFFKNGALVESFSGASKDKLKEAIVKHK